MEFLVLGALEAWHDGVPVAVTGSKQRRALAALVCDAGQTVSAERLVDAIWPDSPPATARRQVQNTVSLLRQTPIGEFLVARVSGYALKVARDQVDALRFEDCLSRAAEARSAGAPLEAITALRVGLSLWRGPALAGVGGPAAAVAAARLEERRLAALTEWAEVALELGRCSEVVEELTEVVGSVPLREPLTGLLMLALYRSGRAAEALTRYHQTRHALAEELGVEPGRSLRTLFERILSEDPSLLAGGGVARNFLPRDGVDFVGRTEEVDQLLGRAEAGGGAITIQAIDGMAGIGKTALAVRVAHRLAGRFRDGQLFVDLRGYDERREPVTVDEALDVLLRAIGVPDERIPKNTGEKGALWRAELAERQVLIVLDNAASSAQVRPLLPASPRSCVLITSRGRLLGLDNVAILSLDVLPAEDAVALFAQVAGAARMAREPEAVAEAARLCGYLPLAVGIAATRLRAHPTWTVGHLVERLAEQHQRQHMLAAEDRSVSAALTVSYQHLTDQQQRLYRVLALHPGASIDRYTAAALADLSLRSVEPLLDGLSEAHMLTEGHPGRYGFHDLVRDHAQTCTDTEDTEDQRDRARDRLLDYYLHVSETAANLVSPSRRRIGPEPCHPPTAMPALSSAAGALTWIETEYGNLLPIVRLSADHGSGQYGWQIARNIGNCLNRRGDLATGRTVLELAVAASQRPGSDPRARIACLSSLSMVLLGLSDQDAALDCLHRSIACARAMGEEDMEADLLPAIANLHIRRGEYPQALDVIARAARIYQDKGNLGREALMRAMHIGTLVEVGRVQPAYEAARAAQPLVQRLGGGRGAFLLLSRIGAAYSRHGEHDLATELLDSAVKGAEEDRAQLAQADYLTLLAQALNRAGRHQEALERAGAALDILCEAPEASILTDAHNALGETCRQLKRYDEALNHLRQALTIAEEAEYRFGQACALDRMGQVLLARGDVAAARECRRQARDLYTELGISTDITVTDT